MSQERLQRTVGAATMAELFTMRRRAALERSRSFLCRQEDQEHRRAAADQVLDAVAAEFRTRAARVKGGKPWRPGG